MKQNITGKTALISMGCVLVCSSEEAIEILLGKKEIHFDTAYSYDITDVDNEGRKNIAKEIKRVG